MKEKVCLITGASSGIGKAAASELAKKGFTVILTGRNENKVKSVMNEIREKSGNDSLDYFIADLSSLTQIRNLTDEFKKKYQYLHVLINNAGTYFTKRHLTEDGYEMTFVVNYLSRFLMTNLFLDMLKKSAPARIIEVAGAYHTKGKINLDDLHLKDNYSAAAANNQSKLANVLFTYELSRRLEDTNITVNCLHPGAIATNLMEKDPDFSGFSKIIYKLFRVFFKKPQKGTETILYLATSPEVESISGKYYVNKKQKKSSPDSYDIQLARLLWDTSTKLVNL